MNLIEQLGGYEAAKAKIGQINHTLENSELLGGGDAREGLYERLESIEKALLEYRRQHNIFEVGDIAVNSRGDESRLLKIWKVDVCPTDKRMSIADYDADGLAGWSRFHCLRHATDAEIKSGKRL